MLSDRVANTLLFFVLVMVVLTALFYGLIFISYSPGSSVLIFI